TEADRCERIQRDTTNRQEQSQEEGDAEQSHAMASLVVSSATDWSHTGRLRARNCRDGRHQRPDGPAASTPRTARTPEKPAEPAGTFCSFDMACAEYRAHAGADPGLLPDRDCLRSGLGQTTCMAARPPAANAIRPGSPGQRAGGGRSPAGALTLAWTAEKRFLLPRRQ